MTLRAIGRDSQAKNGSLVRSKQGASPLHSLQQEVQPLMDSTAYRTINTGRQYYTHCTSIGKQGLTAVVLDMVAVCKPEPHKIEGRNIISYVAFPSDERVCYQPTTQQVHS